MKLALIPPSTLADWTNKTKYQLALPACMNHTRYKLTYRQHCTDKEQFVILDNGAAEGDSISPEELAHIGSQIRTNEVVIPDIIGDKDGTIALAMKFHDAVVPPRNMPPLPFDMMFVVQGQTFIEVLQCANWALSQDWIHTIGVPRHMVRTLDDQNARSRIVNMLASKPHPKPMHMLGASPYNPLEIMALSDPFRTDQKYLRGLDTSLPFSYTYAGRKIDDGSDVVVNRPENYFECPAAAFDRELLLYNVNLFLSYAKG